METFGSFIKIKMIKISGKRGYSYTQNDLSADTGIEYSRLSRILNGHVELRTGEEEKIQAALDAAERKIK